MYEYRLASKQLKSHNITSVAKRTYNLAFEGTMARLPVAIHHFFSVHVLPLLRLCSTLAALLICFVVRS